MVKLELVAGQKIDISMSEVEGNHNAFSVSYDKLIEDVDKGSVILLDDGLIQLEVTGKDEEQGLIHTLIVNSGTLKNKKGVNVPGVSVQLPGMTEKDAEDILFGIEQGVDFIAASFVRRASDVMEIRSLSGKKIMAPICKSFLKLKTKKASITSTKSLTFRMV